MLFTSLDFLLFLPLVFGLYWLLNRGSLRLQNALILVASYIFYGWWDYRFLSLIVASSVVDFVVGLWMGRTEHRRLRASLLVVSLAFNLGLLAVFKYFNFFAQSLQSGLAGVGIEVDVLFVNLILPVGISFYTFQTLSYTIDIYRRRIEPTRDIVAFFAFVAFFPQLVAGPIERAHHLLAQFTRPRLFDYARAVDGCREILWGFFKKVVIADTCAVHVNLIFSDYANSSPSTLLLGALLFSFQIYGDFSGYSHIAVGTSRLFGFDLMANFRYPYFSRDLGEFWRRWHISLSTWFRDYVYIPLGGNQCGRGKAVRNLLIVFLVSGLWHGANWTFVVWGLLNALAFLPLFYFGVHRKHLGDARVDTLRARVTDGVKILATFFFVTGLWVIFRSESLDMAGRYLYAMIAGIAENPRWLITTAGQAGRLPVVYFIGALVTVEWLQRTRPHGLDLSGRNLPTLVRYGIYYLLVALILGHAGQPQDFIYFQF